MGNSVYRDLQEMDNKFQNNSEKLLGKGLLTNSKLIASSRMLMVSSNIEQGVNLKYSELPKYFTAFENMFGKYSEDAYLETKTSYDVIARVEKYENLPGHMYTMILKCKKTGDIHIIEKKRVEDLAEYYGFEYDTTEMDSYNAGDTIKEESILYKSKSFDSDMNFRYGLNAKNLYLCLTENTEDAIIICDSLRDKLTSIEVESIKVSININDTLTNLYGKDKTFPDIGETVKDRIISNVRRIDYSQVAHALSADNLSMILNNDQSYYTSNKDSKVIDINIYSNYGNWDFENTQIKKYFENQCRYQETILNILSEYKDAGCTLTDEALHMHNYFKNALDSDINWTSDGKEFNNIVVEFLVTCESKVEIGSKLVGRYGDKGVVSNILPDEMMPITENGIRAEMISTGDGVIGRLNPGQLFETESNFIGDRIIEKLRNTDAKYDECRKDLIDFLTLCDKGYGGWLDNYIKSLNEEDSKLVISNMMDNLKIRSTPDFSDDGMDIVQLEEIYNRFDIDKYTMYVNCRGRKVKMLRKCVLGDKYVIRLKHTPKSKFSARSVYKINNKRQPCKSKDVKQNKIPHSKTPVRFGEMEFAIIAAAMPDKVRDLMDMHTAVGATEFMYTTKLDSDTISHENNTNNRSFEILNIYLNTMGISLDVCEGSGSSLFVDERNPGLEYELEHVSDRPVVEVTNEPIIVEKARCVVTKCQ